MSIKSQSGVTRHALFAACLLLSLITACAKPERPNVLIITLDTVRTDHIGCYGFKPGLTPAIDSLAAGGVRFSRAIAPAPITLPSHVSIFTGQYPIRHGVRDNSVYILSQDAVTLAELLLRTGYRTGASVSSIALSSRFGVQQGFERFEQGHLIIEDGHQGVAERNGAEITDETLRFLDEMKNSEAPFFYWAHYYDAHEPYIWHPEIDPGPAKAPYESEIRYVDGQVGRILNHLKTTGLDASTLVVVVADHGEGLGQHNERSHVVLTYETTLSVPFIMAGPRIRSGEVVEGCLARLVDILPTVLEAASIDPPAGITLDGVSLLPLCAVEAGSASGPDVAYFETMGPVSFDWAPLNGVSTLEWKYIRGPTEELYHLPSDPGELIEVQGDHPDVLSRLSKTTDAFAAISSKTGEICEMAGRQSELFGAIGYLSLDPRSRKPSIDAPHPRDMVSILDILDYAQSYYIAGRNAEALDYYEKCIALSPGTAMFHEFLAKTKRRLGDHEGSIRAYRKALEIHPEMIDARLTLGIALVNAGDMQAAEKELREVIQREPGLKKGYGYLANLMHQQKRIADEIEVLEALLANVVFKDNNERIAFQHELARARSDLEK